MATATAKKGKTKRRSSHVEIDPDVMAEIEKSAAASDRTVKAEIRHALRKRYLPDSLAAE